MGYDDDECILCYVKYGHNNLQSDDDGKKYVCSDCIRGEYMNYKVDSALSRVYTSRTECEVCKREVLCHQVTLCDGHESGVSEAPLEDFYTDEEEAERKKEFEEYLNKKYGQLFLEVLNGMLPLELMAAACKKVNGVFDLDYVYGAVKLCVMKQK